MGLNSTPAHLFAGIDNLSLDERKFDPSRDDIERACRFFSVGKLRHYEKEKGIIVSHSNFFVFAETDKGPFAFKFYPLKEARSLAVEYAVNRLLIGRHFPTPVMHAGQGGQPFVASHGRLAACFSYIDGLPAWQCIKQRDIFPKINRAILSLNDILSSAQGRIPLEKQTSLVVSVNSLAKASRSMAPYDSQKMIEANLKDALQTYQQFQTLFTRRPLHNNVTLANILIFKNTAYMLDLSHIREDYSLAGLASLAISCLFFGMPLTTVKAMAKDYFTQHKIDTGHFIVLNTLVRIGLIKEYLKNIEREKTAAMSPYPPELVRTYRAHLSKRKELIINVLKKINDNPKAIV